MRASQIYISLQLTLRYLGSSDHRDIGKELERAGKHMPGIAKNVERIRKVAEITHRARQAEMRRDYSREQARSRSRGIDLGR